MLNDNDLDLLDQYLDGALDDGEERQLEARLRSEPEMAGALAQLKSDRDVRAQMWRGIEAGEEASVESLLTRVEAALDRREGWMRRLQSFRLPSAAAACILVGFMAGWVGRVPSAGIDAMATNNRAPAAYDVALKDESGKVVAVQRFENIEKAREFAEDLGRWQERQAQVQSGNVMLVGDTF